MCRVLFTIHIGIPEILNLKKTARQGAAYTHIKNKHK